MPGRDSSIVALICAALLVVAACQSGPDRLSAEEFREQANAACDRARSEIEDLDPVDVGDPEAAAETVARTTEIQRSLGRSIDELVPPAAGQGAYDEWLRQIDVVVEQSAHLTAALRTGDENGQTAANEAGSEAVEAAWAAARELGADECVDTRPLGTGDPAAP